jgi:hypothetical protein
MKYAVNGFRLVEDFTKHQRGLLAVTVLAQEEAAKLVEETEVERELRLFLAGEISFMDCQFVPAKYRVFEHPRFYGAPVPTVSQHPPIDVEVIVDEVILEATTAVVAEDKPSALGWGWLDAWGDPQPACC